MSEQGDKYTITPLMGILSFHEKNWKKIIFFHDYNLSDIKLYISFATSWKKTEWKSSNIDNLDDTHFVPL